MGIRCADHVTPLYPQKLALTSPTGGGRSVGIVRSRTKVTEFLCLLRPQSGLGLVRSSFRHLGRLATAGPVSWFWIFCTISLSLKLDIHWLSIKHSPRQGVPMPYSETGGSSAAYLVSFLLCNHYLLLRTIIWNLWQLHRIAVSSPSPFLSNEVGSTPWSNNIWDTSDQSRLPGGYISISPPHKTLPVKNTNHTNNKDS